MIEPVKPVGAVEYTTGTKSVRDSAAQTQQEDEASYIVDISSTRGNESTDSKLSPDQIAQIKSQADAANASLRALVEKLLAKQGSTYRTAFGDIELNSDMTAAEAQEAISEDGYWGVNAVSDRIVAFAKAVSGGDTDKLEELKAAIDKGFKLASRSFGGELPGICGDTYNAVMNKLDKWASESGVDVEA